MSPDALLHAAQAAQGAGEGALSHGGHAGGVAGVELGLALLVQTVLLAVSECEERDEYE